MAGIHQMLFIGANPSVRISDRTLTDTRTDNAKVQYILDVDGVVYDVFSNALEIWLRRGVVADYDVRATVTAGTNPTAGSALNSWLNLNTLRYWEQLRTSNGTNTCTMTIEIRSVATLAVLDSATVVLEAINT